MCIRVLTPHPDPLTQNTSSGRSRQRGHHRGCSAGRVTCSPTTSTWSWATGSSCCCGATGWLGGALGLAAAFLACSSFLVLQGWGCSTPGSGEILGVFFTCWFSLCAARLLRGQQDIQGFGMGGHEPQSSCVLKVIFPPFSLFLCVCIHMHRQ